MDPVAFSVVSAVRRTGGASPPLSTGGAWDEDSRVDTETEPVAGDGERDRRQRRFPLWFLWPVVAVLLLAGLWMWRFARAERVIAEHKARLPAEWAAIAPLLKGRAALVEPTEPGDASEVVEAFLTAVEAVPESEQERLALYADPKGSPEEQDAILAAHPEPVTLLTRILRVSQRVPAPGRSLREGARSFAGRSWLEAALDRALAHKDATRVVETAIAMAAFGEEVGRSALLQRGVAWPIERIALWRLMDAIGLGGLTADGAHRARVALDVMEAARPTVAAMLAMERMNCRAIASALEQDIVERAMGPRGRWEIGWRWLWSWTLLRAAALEETDPAFDAVERAVTGGDWDALAAVRRLRMTPECDTALVREAVNRWPDLIEDRATVRAQAVVVRTALALVEEAAKHGTPPASLSELVPAYFPVVPTDPWDGKPLRYAPGKVWSVGGNGVDDGGATDDVVVVLPPAR